MRVTIAVPNRDDFKAEMITSLMLLITQTQAKVNLSMPQTCYLDDARNTCWEDAVNFDSDWLLFMDSDNSVSCGFNVFERMISLDKDVLSGVYVMRVHPYRPLIYDFTEEGLIRNRTEIPSEPFRADASGCGLLLISKRVMKAFTPEVIEKYGKPFDFLNYGKPNMLREDPAFCWRIKQLGFELWFDPSIIMGHIGKHTFSLEHFNIAKQMVTGSDETRQGIAGFMSETELEFLSGKAKEMETVAEIGSWKGRSTKALLDAGAKVTAIDHWKGTPEIELLTDEEDVFKTFMDNVGHYENLSVMRMSSQEASEKLNGDMFDMVFIDADHSYKECKRDIDLWLPRAKKLIAIHDYSKEWPGVIQAVNEKFSKVNVTDTIAWVEVK